MSVEVLTIAEAAERLRIGRSTAFELVRRGEFPVPVFRVGTRWRVSAQALDDLISGRT